MDQILDDLGDEYARIIASQASVRDSDFHSGRCDLVYLRQVCLEPLGFLMSTDRTERHSSKSKRVA